MIEITKVYSPGLKLPNYIHGPTSSQATLAHFENCCVVVPMHMLKEHVESDEVRSTPVEEVANSTGSVSIPTADDTVAANTGADEEATDENSTGIKYTGDGYTDEDFDEVIGELNSADIEAIRAGIIQMGKTENGSNILK